MIHRDVKPQNVMVVAEPAAGAGFAKLADFGVAHVVSDDPLTHTGDVVGTLAYMAPEQAEGARVDAGQRRLLARADALRGLDRHQPDARRRPRRHRPPARPPAALARRQRRDLPLELCDAIDDALELDPARRPTPRELRAELAAAEPELADEGGLVEPETLRRVGLPTTQGRGPL